MAATTRGAAADAAFTVYGEAPSRMVRLLNRVRDVLEPVGETLAVVSSVLGIVVGAMEIVQDVRYIVDSARGTLAHGGGGGAVDLAGDALSRISKGLAPAKGDGPGASVRAKLENKLIHTAERSYHHQWKLIRQTRRDIAFENLPESPWLLESSCKFFGLKHLKLLMFHLDDDMHNILSLASFLKAAPLTEILEIDFNIFGLINDLETDSLRSLPNCPYNYLKNVCITGYQGDIGQLELVVHIVQNAPALEVLIIDRTTKRGAHVNQHSGEWPGIVVRRHLDGKLLPTTKLEII